MFTGANIVRQMVTRFHISRARRWRPTRSPNEGTAAIDLARLFHLTDCDVGQFVVDAEPFPERLRWYAQGQGRLDLVLRDDSSDACHYQFDSHGCEKVVRPPVSTASFDQLRDLTRPAANSNGNIGRSNAALSHLFE